MEDFIFIIARLLLGVPFILWGIMKLRGGEAKLVPVLAGMGLPDAKAFAYLVGICELVGGVGVVIGFPLVLVSIPLGVWCLITGYVGHRNDINQLLAHVAMGGGFFALAASRMGTI